MEDAIIQDEERKKLLTEMPEQKKKLVHINLDLYKTSSIRTRFHAKQV